MKLSIKVPHSGLYMIGSISSSYATIYPNQLKGIISHDEFVDIIERLNDTIQNYWPCLTCYMFGYGFVPCTMGLSLSCPKYCTSKAEEKAKEMLKNVSLKAKYFDRQISFHLVKSWFSSHIEIQYPSTLINNELDILETNEKANLVLSEPQSSHGRPKIL